jgi:hypothetical protein
MLPPCLDASGGMILRAMGFGWGKQARVCFPLSLGKARGVDPPPRGHPVRLATKENVAYLLDSLCDISHNAVGEQDGPKRPLNVR